MSKLERPLTRRNLLGLLGTAGVGGALAAGATFMQLSPEIEAHVPQARPAAKKRQWGMVIDLRRCDGCKKCTEACQETHHLPKSFEWIKVFEMEDKNGRQYFMPRPCMHCENAPCLKVCPVAATFKAADGVILVDQFRCIGCRACMAACPYGARTFNYADPPAYANPFGQPTPEFPVPQQTGTVGKCMLCVHRTDSGQLPACVEACGMKAIYVGDFVEDVATNGDETVRLSRLVKDNDAFRYKEELNTSPRVYYIAGHGQDWEG